MNNSFEKLGLDGTLVEAMTKVGFTEPTEIQEKVVPLVLQNKDVVGQSETGSGKTLAYLLPLFQKIDAGKREMQAFILAPTHELVMQIQSEAVKLSDNAGVNIISLPIIGEANILRQIEKLREKPHVIVGTAGRVLELIKRKKISAHTVKTIVVDEADKLLDKNNVDNIKAVIKTTLRERQLLFFSATMPEQTLSTIRGIAKDLEVIKAEKKDLVNADITHIYFTCEKREKIEVLRKLVHALKPSRAIVFINKSDEIEITAAKLKYHKLKAESIHGSNLKEDRKKALEDFRTGKIQLLVASDIAARGLDIKEVTHIINLDLPEDPKDYLHRAGRTGRAGEKGVAISLADVRDMELINKYQKSLGIELQEKIIYMGKVNDKGAKRTFENRRSAPGRKNIT